MMVKRIAGIMIIGMMVGFVAGCHLDYERLPYTGEPLVVKVLSPLSNAVCPTNIAVSGTVSDASTVDSIIVFIKTADNIQTNFAVATLSGTEFQASLLFPYTTNCALWARAVDSVKGTYNSVEIPIKIASIPSVKVLSPVSIYQTYYTNVTNITISGEMGYADGVIESFTYIVSNSAQTTFTTNPMPNWSLDLDNLEIGTNVILFQIKATDGKENQLEWIKVIVDTNAPIPTVLEPSVGEKVGLDFAVSGTVLTPNPLVSAIGYVSNGLSLQSFILSIEESTNLKGNIHVNNNGDAWIWFVVKDRNGNTGHSATNLFLVEIKPQLGLTSPDLTGGVFTAMYSGTYVSGQSTIQSPYNVTNTVLISSNAKTGIVNDYFFSYNNYWNFYINFPEGSNHIKLYSMADNGINSIEKKFIIVGAYKPNAWFDYPAAFEEVTPYYTVRGTAFDDSSGVEKVYLALNNAEFKLLNGTSFWETNVYFGETGIHTVKVFAVDSNGNVSDTNWVTVQVQKKIYVSSIGIDTASGSKLRPVRNLTMAIERALTNNASEIYISQGIFGLGSGLETSDYGLLITNHNFKFYGSYDYGFSMRDMVNYPTVFNGMDTIKQVVSIRNVTNIMLDSIIIRNGMANGVAPYNSGGGLYITNASKIVLNEVIFVSNSFGTYGSALYMAHVRDSDIKAHFMTNMNGGNGTVFMLNCHSNRLDGYLINNVANYGGGVYMNNSHSNTLHWKIVSNTATNHGGGIYLLNSSNNVLSASGMVVYNKGLLNGGGIYLQGGFSNVYYGNVSMNETNNIYP